MIPNDTILPWKWNDFPAWRLQRAVSGARKRRRPMIRDLLVVLFAVTAGFTASGLVANVYRLIGKKAQNPFEKTAYIAVMVIAGPNVLFENAANSVRAKSCSKMAFFLAAAVTAYWSFAIGLFILDMAITFRG
jgi:hypothetical protein